MGMEEVDGLYLQNLEEYVLDEDKIVTYKWLSKTLEVHVNVAKRMLYSFIQDQRKKKGNDKLEVTYLVGGQLKDEPSGAYKVMVVKEEDLATVKSTLKMVCSEHVYSVQKTKLKDMNVLYTVDYQKSKEDGFKDSNRFSAVFCDKAVTRTAEELAKLRIKTKVKDSEDNKTANTKSNTASEQSKSKTEKLESSKPEPKKGLASMFAAQSAKKVDNSVESQESKSADKPAKVPQPANKKGIAAMFANQSKKKPMEEKSNSVAVNQSKEVPDKTDIKENRSKKSGIKGMFAAQENKKTEKPAKQEAAQPKKKETEVKVSMKDIEKMTKKKTNKGKKAREDSDDENQMPKKKRKRIVVMSDSESSDDEEVEDDESPFPPSPPPQVQSLDDEDEDIIPPTPTEEKKHGRKRIQKFVSRTYTDEDGYIVTCKEHVVESCSESEPEDEMKPETKVQKEASPKEEKKKNSPQKTKQASLMSFFKKK